MDLPGYTDDLIRAVADANPNTVVVIQSGTPVTMPWVDKVSSIIHAWYGGNETGNAIADVLYGDINPSGKLPLSFPIHVEDNPAFLNYRSERGRVLYGEDIYIGYRFYEATKRPTLYPFGHGLSYTTFELSQLEVWNDGRILSIKLRVENTGHRDGSEVIQAYVTQRSPSVKRPPKELKGFKKQHINAGESEIIEMRMEMRYVTSFWDEGRDMWISEKDIYDVSVGNSSKYTPLRANFEVKETFWWSGL
jgi:beta-glucosidase